LPFYEKLDLPVLTVPTDNRWPGGHRSDLRSGRGQQAAKGPRALRHRAAPIRALPRAQRHRAPHHQVKRPQSNGIVERLHRTLLDEHFRVEGRRTWFETIDEMQAVLDTYLEGYNQRRPHQGRGMDGRTPTRAFKEGMPKPRPTKGEKTLAAIAA
jgi:hypothetical protein